jgi:predicted extracellular nuclease
VFTSSPGVAVGDSVLVSGTVNDFYPLNTGETVSTTSNLSITEIGSPTTIVLLHANALPAPAVITPTTVPSTYAPDLGGADIEPTTVDPARSALDFWESREGMRVEVDDARVVGPSDSFGEQYVTTKPTQAATYRGGTELLAENAIRRGASRSCRSTAATPA